MAAREPRRLTLIQQQVLMSLYEALESEPDVTGKAVRPDRVRMKLQARRPRLVSEQYVRLICRDLVSAGEAFEEHMGGNRKGFGLYGAGRVRAGQLLREERERREKSARLARHARSNG